MDDILSHLRSDKNLKAECKCGKSFRLADAILFRVDGDMPPEAKAWQEKKTEKIKNMKEALERSKGRLDIASEHQESVKRGKLVEKLIPAYSEIRFDIRDYRPLWEPIDFVIFNGLSGGKLDSLRFVDCKSGAASLTNRQKKIREAVRARKVRFETFER